jgi:F-box protein 9
MLQSILKEQRDALSLKHVPTKDGEKSTSSIMNIVNVELKTSLVAGTKTLANILQKIPADIRFEPENDIEPVLLNVLPNELLLLIVGKLDPTSIERFAAVSKKARMLTLDRQIWRYPSCLKS